MQPLGCLHVGWSSASETFGETSSAGDKVSGRISGQRKRGCGVITSSLQQKRYCSHHIPIMTMIFHPGLHYLFSFSRGSWVSGRRQKDKCGGYTCQASHCHRVRHAYCPESRFPEIPHWSCDSARRSQNSVWVHPWHRAAELHARPQRRKDNYICNQRKGERPAPQQGETGKEDGSC